MAGEEAPSVLGQLSKVLFSTGGADQEDAQFELEKLGTLVAASLGFSSAAPEVEEVEEPPGPPEAPEEPPIEEHPTPEEPEPPIAPLPAPAPLPDARALLAELRLTPEEEASARLVAALRGEECPQEGAPLPQEEEERRRAERRAHARAALRVARAVPADAGGHGEQLKALERSSGKLQEALQLSREALEDAGALIQRKKG